VLLWVREHVYEKGVHSSSRVQIPEDEQEGKGKYRISEVWACITVMHKTIMTKLTNKKNCFSWFIDAVIWTVLQVSTKFKEPQKCANTRSLTQNETDRWIPRESWWTDVFGNHSLLCCLCQTPLSCGCLRNGRPYTIWAVAPERGGNLMEGLWTPDSNEGTFVTCKLHEQPSPRWQN
jgi:hypothetical protein